MDEPVLGDKTLTLRAFACAWAPEHENDLCGEGREGGREGRGEGEVR